MKSLQPTLYNKKTLVEVSSVVGLRHQSLEKRLQHEKNGERKIKAILINRLLFSQSSNKLIGGRSLLVLYKS